MSDIDIIKSHLHRLCLLIIAFGVFNILLGLSGLYEKGILMMYLPLLAFILLSFGMRKLSPKPALSKDGIEAGRKLLGGLKRFSIFAFVLISLASGLAVWLAFKQGANVIQAASFGIGASLILVGIIGYSYTSKLALR